MLRGLRNNRGETARARLSWGRGYALWSQVFPSWCEPIACVLCEKNVVMFVKFCSLCGSSAYGGFYGEGTCSSQ